MRRDIASLAFGRALALALAAGALGCWFDVPDLSSMSGAGGGAGSGAASGATGGGSGCGRGSPVAAAFTTPLTLSRFVSVDDGIVMAGSRSGSLKCGGNTLPSSHHGPGEDQLAQIVHLDDAGQCTWGIDILMPGGQQNQLFRGISVDPAGGSHFIGNAYAQFGSNLDLQGPYLLKVGAHGSLSDGFAWQFTGNGQASPEDVAGAPDGGDILVGEFGADTWDPEGVGTISGGCFVLRFGPTGSGVWDAGFDSQAHMIRVSRVISGPAGESVVFASNATAPATDFNGAAAPGPGGVFAAKLDPDGHQVWANTFGADPGVVVTSAALDADGDVFVVGTFKTKFEAGMTKLKPIEDTNLFVAKLVAANGDVTFARALGGASQSTSIDVTADASGKHVWLASTLFDTQDFGCGRIEPLGGGDVVLAELDTDDGAPRFVARYGTSLPERATWIQRSPSGKVRVAGTMQHELDLGSVKLDHGPTTFIATIGDP